MPGRGGYIAQMHSHTLLHIYTISHSTTTFDPTPPPFPIWGAALLFQRHHQRWPKLGLQEPGVWEACLLECASTHSIQTHHTGTHTYTPATHRITHTCTYTCVHPPRKWQTAACLLLLVHFHMHGTRQVYHLYAGVLMHMCVFTWTCVLHAPIHSYL